MSHKHAKLVRKKVRFMLGMGLPPTDPRIAAWADATPREARRAVKFALLRKGAR